VPLWADEAWEGNWFVVIRHVVHKRHEIARIGRKPGPEQLAGEGAMGSCPLLNTTAEVDSSRKWVWEGRRLGCRYFVGPDAVQRKIFLLSPMLPQAEGRITQGLRDVGCGR
jgi:hypothetical protein